ncbi:class I SAM-dependent methyltransferase [Microbacterium sediminicola]|uniref:Class I SAM-dependent methyltransferase n=1 Tax=Microbacterium sediminicola TaxID=415210 RepID=A0ABN2HWQ1_9MICO
MDRYEISRIAHSDHPIAAPVSTSAARRLLSHLKPTPSGRVLDLGCGAGAWLFELLIDRADLTATGVDISLHPDRGDLARARDLSDRITWIEADAAAWASIDDERYDTILSIGATHAFDGLDGTLDAIRDRLHPGGRVLVGDAIWEHPPTPAALEALGAEPGDYPTLAEFLATAERHGFEVGYAHLSTAAEWDEYEWSWTGSLVAWAQGDVSAAHREQALEAARAHRTAWLEGYRGQLGFVTAVLHDIR